MQHKPPQELVGADRHLSLLVAVSVILPAEDDLTISQLDEAMVGNGDPVGVARQVMEHMLRSTKRRLGVDHPILAEQLAKESAESLFSLQRLEAARKQQFLFAESALQARHEFAAEDAAEYFHGQEESVAGMDPPLAVQGEAAGGNHTMDVWMMIEPLAPGM